MSGELGKTLLYISLQLYRYVPIAELLLGTFGNIMNVLIFMRPSLRSNPCSFYFWISSINNLFYLYVGLLTRMLASGWSLDPTQKSNILCKLRIFFVYTSSSLIQWYMIVASIDRYFSSCTSTRIRQWSTVKVARKVTLLTTIIVMVVYFHLPVWFSVEPIDGSSSGCNIYNYEYQIFFSVFDIFVSSLFPPLLMIIFGLKTVSNFRQLRRMVMPTDQNDVRHARLRSKDRQMIVMLLIQVAATMIVNVPYTVLNLYYYIHDNIKSGEANEVLDAILNLLSDIFLLLNYLAPVLGFYIYTLSGTVFRHEMKHILRHGFGHVVMATKMDRCLPEHIRRKLYQSEVTVITEQSISLTRINKTMRTKIISVVA